MRCSYFEFAAKFCNELDKTKNCVFSPLMAAEIIISAKALKSIVPFDEEYPNGIKISTENNIPLSNILLSYKLKSIKGVTVNRANNIYLTNEHKINKKQKKYVKEIFKVKIKNIDFNNILDAAAHINKGMEKKTKGRIKDYVKYTDFDINSEIILVNGLYFKGLWYKKFDPDNTEETIFFINNNETVNVFLMYRRDKYNYKDCPDLDSQLLILPFKDREAHMLIVLPKRVSGLDAVLQKLADGYNLMSVVENMSDYVDVAVNIPRYKIETEINLVEVLHKLGMTTIFDKAWQKVLIEVNEEGTEPKPEPCRFIPRWMPKAIDFTADHPHLIVVIYENIPVVWVTFRGRFE